MKKTNLYLSGSLTKQRGFVFRLIHSLLIVALVVGLVLLYRAGKLPSLEQVPEKVTQWVDENTPTGSETLDTGEEEASNKPWSSGGYIQTHQQKPVTRPKEDKHYLKSRYAVQIAAGYDSRQLYTWRDELIADGYQAYLVSLNTPRGLMFKLRVGAYNKREQAENIRERLKRRYPQQPQFADSFVVEGQ